MTKKRCKSTKLVVESRMKKHFEDYCASTSIHGIKYLGERDRPPVERLWWIIVFILSFIGSTYLIYKVWYKWQISPVIVSFAETSTLVWQVPFPAVTICSETKSRQSVFNFTEAIYSGNLTEEQEKNMKDVALVCDHHVATKGEKTTDESTIEFLKEVAPPFDELLWFCRWKISRVNCSELFKPVMTEEGLCYSFNSLHASELYKSITLQSKEEDPDEEASQWSLEDGYLPTAPLETYPRRALGAGANNAIGIVLRAYEQDLDYYCRGPVQGFKILLHNPAEFPRVSERYFRVPLDNEIVMSVQPNIMTTSIGLKGYSPDNRQCYFPTERPLALFKVYTQRNCELECLANFTLKRCGCVMFYMPRQENTPICASGSKNCTKIALEDLSLEQITLTVQKSDSGNTCNCLPACTALQYESETSQANFDWKKLFSAYKENETAEFDGKRLSRVVIYFKESQFMSSRRSELYGITDFLANCGGLLGLFSGFSILSLVEIIYYITLRFWNNIKKHHEHIRPENEKIHNIKFDYEDKIL